MKLLSFLFLICVACKLFISCLNTNTKKTLTENTNRITSDELMYEIMTTDAQLAYNYNIPDSPENRQVSGLNNGILQEIFVVYAYLIMSDDQIMLFEFQFNTTVKESNLKILSQTEIQEKMDFSFETVIDEEKYIEHHEWRIAGTQ